MVTIKIFCLLCITKRPGQTLHSLLHLTRMLPSIQHSCMAFDPERRKTMMTFRGDILFINVSPHPPSLCQTLIPVAQRHGRTPLQFFSLCADSMPHEHALLFSSWPPCEQLFCHRCPVCHLKKKKNLKEILSANSLQKINGILCETTFSLSKLAGWPQLHVSRHKEILIGFDYTDPLWAAVL